MLSSPHPTGVNMLLFSVSWTADGGPGALGYGGSVGAAGDVNGDGYADVIVGASGFADTQSAEGAVFVYLGASTGLYGTDPAWTADSDQEFAALGTSVAGLGDVNGDGYADAGAGAPGMDRAFAWHGGPYGLDVTAAWAGRSDELGARYGAAMAGAGDVNGDGYGDIAVGASADEGRAFLYLGAATGLADDPIWTADGNEVQTNLGASLASAGDVDADGYDDVVVGAAARADLYMGSAGGLEPAAAWTATEGTDDAGFGRSVSGAGDVDGDGYADVVAGALLFDDAFGDDGAAFAYAGSSNGPSADPEWSVTGHQAGAHLGASVAGAGDVNADGYDDVAVGAPAYDAAFVDNGRVTVYLGAATGISTRSIWTGDGPPVAGAAFGTAVATAGDVDADGFADLIVGAPLTGDGGRVYVFYGGFGNDADGDGVFDTIDECLGDDASGDADRDDVCALAVDGAVQDCDDTNDTVYPGAPELCDGLDTSCTGILPANESDADGDLGFPCGGDCDDSDPAAGPNHAETCGDLIDNDCDGELDESCGPGEAAVTEPDATGCGCASTGAAGTSAALSLAALAWVRRARRTLPAI